MSVLPVSSSQRYYHGIVFLFVVIGTAASVVCAFRPVATTWSRSRSRIHNNIIAGAENHPRHNDYESCSVVCRRASNGNNDDDSVDDSDPSGANLAAELFRMAQQKGIDLSDDDLEDEDDDEDEDDEDDEDEEEEEEVNIPQGAINAFLGYDTGDVGDKLAGNVTLTDDQLYSEVKERVLDTAGGFLEYVRGARDEEEEDEDDETGESEKKPYQPPAVVPDPELTAGEVILTVLEALNHNDVPTVNKGVDILFRYSSEGSQIKNEAGLTVGEYADFLKETEYGVLFSHEEVTIDKADYSYDGKKAFFTARLRTGANPPNDAVAVNFILSTTKDDDSCWLIDSFLIRPQSMRRRRRK